MESRKGMIRRQERGLSNKVTGLRGFDQGLRPRRASGLIHLSGREGIRAVLYFPYYFSGFNS